MQTRNAGGWQLSLPALCPFPLVFFYICIFIFCLFRAASTAYGDSQARGPIRSAAASLHHSHNNVGFEPCLRPTPQLMATGDP